jgi:hypothetical protein
MLVTVSHDSQAKQLWSFKDVCMWPIRLRLQLSGGGQAARSRNGQYTSRLPLSGKEAGLRHDVATVCHGFRNLKVHFFPAPASWCGSSANGPIRPGISSFPIGEWDS